VRAVLVLVVPGVFEELQAAQHGAGIAHEGLEQGDLLRRRGDLGAGAGDAAAGRVELEVADAEHGRPGIRPAPDQRPDPRLELREREWLRQVVVRAAVAARNTR